MIIDIFPFYNESEILEFRIKILSPVVDKFFILEADHTFSGRKKPFNFNKDRFRQWKDKIIFHKVRIGDYLKIDELNLSNSPTEYDPTHDCWKIEYAQRNAVKEVLDNLSDNDIIIWGDVDEIPSREAVQAAYKHRLNLPVVYDQAFFYYNLKFRRQEAWRGSIFCTTGMLKEKGGQAMRDMRNRISFVLKPGGWHLSYFGSVDKIKNKIENFSHQECNTEEFKKDIHIEGCIKTGRDLFNRSVSVAPVERNFFPPYFLENINEEWL